LRLKKDKRYNIPSLAFLEEDYLLEHMEGVASRRERDSESEKERDIDNFETDEINDFEFEKEREHDKEDKDWNEFRESESEALEVNVLLYDLYISINRLTSTKGNGEPR